MKKTIIMKKHIRNIVIFSGIAFLISSCTKQESKNKVEDMNIKLSWGMITNMLKGDSSCRASFTIHNKSNQTLSDSGWAIYYSQSPREITNAPNAKAIVKHISGDWFKIIPEQGFSLSPEEKLVVHYDLSHYLINETDAPHYPYIVRYDDNGNETSIEKITDYTIFPFEKPEQINRGSNDVVPIPTPANRYQDNQGLSLLADNTLHKIIPTPVHVNPKDGNLNISNALKIYYSSDLKSEAII